MGAISVSMLLSGVSPMLFGCAKKAQDGQPVPDGTGANALNKSDAKGLAGLFQIDTDKPIGDEGLDMDGPSVE